MLRTDLLRLTVYRTDAGSLDKNGEPQPTFLNFDAQLLHPPAHEMQERSCVQSFHFLASYSSPLEPLLCAP